MNVSGIKAGDIVRVSKKGRIFHGLVETILPATEVGRIVVRPIERGITYRQATPREVVGVWRASKGTQP